jgi:hypothetical protein
MSWTHDRSHEDRRLLFVVVIGIAVVAAAGGFFFWTHLRATDAAQRPPVTGADALIQPAFRTEPLAVTLFYPVDGALATRTAPAKRQPDTQAQARECLASLLADQRASQAEVLRDVRLKSFYLDDQGTAYVDLLPQQQPLRASAWDEQLALFAMVNTLTQNFEEIKQVRFLVEERDAQTLAGHMDLSRKFRKRLDLVRQ